MSRPTLEPGCWSLRRALFRLAAYAGVTAVAVAPYLVLLLIARPIAAGYAVLYHRICCRILGFRVRHSGETLAPGPSLVVANHVSYIDIPVLGSVLAGSFVAKSEVRDWPIFGLLAKLQRTVFVERRRHRAGAASDQIARRLGHGDRLILFPEGTSSDGRQVLPFKSALLGAAGGDGRAGDVSIQPVSISYTAIAGLPIVNAYRPLVAWYGDMDLAPHLLTVVGMPQITIDVAVHAAVPVSAIGDRKALAQYCHQQVSEGVARLQSGVEATAPARPRRFLPRPVQPGFEGWDAWSTTEA